jgi:hypothetical protein
MLTAKLFVQNVEKVVQRHLIHSTAEDVPVNRAA